MVNAAAFAMTETSKTLTNETYISILWRKITWL